MQGHAAKEHAIIDLTVRQLAALREFLAALKEERDAIISFSLEGIIIENNRKEEILKKIECLEKEKERVVREQQVEEPLPESHKLNALHSDIHATTKEVRVYMEKNMKLLSFSMDHVRSTIERIVGFINRTTYGRKTNPVSFVVSRNA
jgi:flagellar biosynthesis/type III secretory pathway chaperone